MAARGVLGLARATLAIVHFTQKPSVAEVIRIQISPRDKGTFSSNDFANVTPD